ncbi:hypothetical protein PHLGIDRAFT_17224 [Phlebiopsis gigantea 11061_1 CR5-6]|uniref:Uncharacterized protein n=1 Tax=Phlebiopsis gigantea (strain 11061_1 CR5-6) TaxID=745531 RepID=A0A0C3P9M9_PHLG1|nr:hypothetical protein PHLGIDRAFT_17224 [Phlebiopsis gigantea 11061_1 CR5-6]
MFGAKPMLVTALLHLVFRQWVAQSTGPTFKVELDPVEVRHQLQATLLEFADLRPNGSAPEGGGVPMILSGLSRPRHALRAVPLVELCPDVGQDEDERSGVTPLFDNGGVVLAEWHVTHGFEDVARSVAARTPLPIDVQDPETRSTCDTSGMNFQVQPQLADDEKRGGEQTVGRCVEGSVRTVYVEHQVECELCELARELVCCNSLPKILVGSHFESLDAGHFLQERVGYLVMARNLLTIGGCIRDDEQGRNVETKALGSVQHRSHAFQPAKMRQGLDRAKDDKQGCGGETRGGLWVVELATGDDFARDVRHGGGR